MNEYSEKFWRDVERLSTTVKAATPLTDGCGLQEILWSHQSATPQRQEQMRHDISLLIARLIQIDRALQACREGTAEVGTH